MLAFPLGYKRLPFDAGYLGALGRLNVSVTFGEDHERRVEMTPGEEIPVDGIIFATGFTVDEYSVHVSGVDYILMMIVPVLSGAASSFFVTPAACDAYNVKVQRRLEGSVLIQCVSWYRAGGTGKVTSMLPAGDAFLVVDAEAGVGRL
ncbi:hypothetical protein FIBSPDRAFT_957339 [Athelia psychrophila]|uniref:FAD/NAD(P)-binding domain-containing protein n=1 Tax=Athelia psychrophila TaxID=1759441 RepID=A0A166FU36_9AGAM|nr:hypothetical protein FIBSPDRAFT_957339 [Fibularhizoctonia sp. CBS 109695]